MANAAGGVIDLTRRVVAFDRDGGLRLLDERPGPPERVDGWSVGAPAMTQAPPHQGERHPDGDELVLLVSGAVTVVLEDEEPPRRVRLRPGEAIVIPRGVWHRVLLDEPSQLVHVTPGPNDEYRPLES